MLSKSTLIKAVIASCSIALAMSILGTSLIAAHWDSVSQYTWKSPPASPQKQLSQVDLFRDARFLGEEDQLQVEKHT